MDQVDPRKLAVSDFVWDMFPHSLPLSEYQGIQETLGLVPSDPDGLAYQHKMAHARKEAYAPLKDVTDLFGTWAGEVVTEYTIRSLRSKGMEVPDLPPDMREFFNNQNANVLQLGAQVIIMRMLERGIIKMGDGIGPQQPPDKPGNPGDDWTPGGNGSHPPMHSARHLGLWT